MKIKKDIFFKSEEYPLTAPFWLNLQEALINLPNNPKPECGGFCLSHFNSEEKILTTEIIGVIPLEKELKYLCCATNMVLKTLEEKVNRSKELDPSLNCPQGSFFIKTRFGNLCEAIYGHDPSINEAISCLSLLTKCFIFEQKENLTHNFLIYDSLKERQFYMNLRKQALQLGRNLAPENNWIKKIATIMVDNC